ncbi:MAG: arylamine N-acetyltransferase [Eubacteriaceae bacterium]|nr:arylamine N-acetyltransferase [Eubacteriaceae bacterium]
MSEVSFKISNYLKRIKYEGKTDVSYETLRDLHVAHTLNVPFENLDVYYGKPILLDKEVLFEKIVENKRGGYCFEMNGLFSFVLQEMGFKVRNLLARVTRDGKTYFAKTHQVLMVEIDDKRYLADVGFGMDGLTAPLELVTGVDQQQFTHTYRLLEDPKLGYILQKKSGEEYQYLYAFTLEECSPLDYLMSNHYTATFPESLFVQMKFCTMPMKDGRITLTDKHFKVMKQDQVSETALSSDAEFKELLKKHFQLDLDQVKSE